MNILRDHFTEIFLKSYSFFFFLNTTNTFRLFVWNFESESLKFIPIHFFSKVSQRRFNLIYHSFEKITTEVETKYFYISWLIIWNWDKYLLS